MPRLHARTPIRAQCHDAGDATLDAAVRMPRGCLLAKDYLNHKFHAKRLLYLRHIADCLAAAGALSGAPQLEALNGDVRRPVLRLRLRGASWALRLHVHAPTSAFVPAKLGPDRNCLRSASAKSTSAVPPLAGAAVTVAARDGSIESQLLATPAYNAGVLADMFYQDHCCALAGLLEGHGELAHAAQLLARWVRVQAPTCSAAGALLEAVLAKLGSAVRSGTVVRPDTACM